jgi:hypothetical protein
LGGGGSSSQISLESPLSVTGTINQFSYSGYSGTAAIDLSPNITGSEWAGTTLKLTNVGDAPAGAATIDVRYSTIAGQTYGGPLTGPLGSAPAPNLN